MLILSQYIAYVNNICYYAYGMSEYTRIGLELIPVELPSPVNGAVILGNGIIGLDHSQDPEHSIRLPRAMANRLARMSLVSGDDAVDCYGFLRIVGQGRNPVPLADRNPTSFALRYRRAPQPVDEIPSLPPGIGLLFSGPAGSTKGHVALSLDDDALLQRFGNGGLRLPIITTVADAMRFYGNDQAEIITPRILSPQEYVAKAIHRVARRRTQRPEQ